MSQPCARIVEITRWTSAPVMPKSGMTAARRAALVQRLEVDRRRDVQLLVDDDPAEALRDLPVDGEVTTPSSSVVAELAPRIDLMRFQLNGVRGFSGGFCPSGM